VGAAQGRRFGRALALVALSAAWVGVWAAPATAAPEVIAQKGYAVSCSGAAGGLTVQVDLYENSFYGTFVTVFVTSPEGELVSDPDAPAPRDVFSDGTITADVPLIQLGEGDGVPVGAAIVRGTYAVAGGPARIHETLRTPATSSSRGERTLRSALTYQSRWTASLSRCRATLRSHST